jgi:hypothetical protein
MTDTEHVISNFPYPPSDDVSFDLAQGLLCNLLVQYENTESKNAKSIMKVFAELLILKQDYIFKSKSDFLVLYQIVRDLIEKPPEELPLNVTVDLETVALLLDDMAIGRVVSRGEVDREAVWSTKLSDIAERLAQKTNCPACGETFYPARAVEESNGLFRCPNCNQLTH